MPEKSLTFPHSNTLTPMVRCANANDTLSNTPSPNNNAATPRAHRPILRGAFSSQPM
jgi:hypothetical protein